jgi:hypothetical protein
MVAQHIKISYNARVCTAPPEEVFSPQQKEIKGGGGPWSQSAWEDAPSLAAVSKWLGKLSLGDIAASGQAVVLPATVWNLLSQLYLRVDRSDCSVLFLTTTHATTISFYFPSTYIHRVLALKGAVCTRPA